ncbi:hypothetical protein BOMU111920_18770 [Bordetella muralis]
MKRHALTYTPSLLSGTHRPLTVIAISLHRVMTDQGSPVLEITYISKLIMKTFTLTTIILSALCAATSVQAAQNSFTAPPVAELSRAQVQAELAEARAAGTLQRGDQTYVPPSVSTRSRTEVKAELAAAIAAGTIQRGDQTYVPPSVSTLSRAEVNTDTAAWRKAGLADEWHGDATPDIYSTAYRQKLAYYQHLKTQQQADAHIAS